MPLRQTTHLLQSSRFLFSLASLLFDFPAFFFGRVSLSLELLCGGLSLFEVFAKMQNFRKILKYRILEHFKADFFFR